MFVLLQFDWLLVLYATLTFEVVIEMTSKFKGTHQQCVCYHAYFASNTFIMISKHKLVFVGLIPGIQ